MPQTYGTLSPIKLHISGASISPVDSGTKVDDGQGYFYNDIGSRLGATVNLPSGVKIEGIDLYYDDTDAAGNVDATLFALEGTTTVTVTVVGTVGSTGNAGKNVAFSGALNHTVVNDNRNYDLYVFGTATNKKVRSVTIRYKLQISLAPPTPTFTDVPTSHPFYAFIEALVAAGITAGCNVSPPQYCPDSPLTRGQMAVFLSRALGLHWTP